MTPAVARPGPGAGDPGPGTRRAARNAAALAAAEIVGKLATLAFTIAAARALGAEGFGGFAYALSFSLLVATVPSWGFDTLLVQRGSADPGRIRQLLGETVVWRAAATVPLLAAGALAAFALRPSREAGVALTLVLAATLIDVLADSGRAAAGALQRQGGVSVALVAQRIAAAGLGIAALAAGLGLVGLSAAYLAGSVVGAAGVAVAVRRLGVGLDLRRVRLDGLRRTAALSLPVGVHALAAMALFRIDQLILGALRGDGAVGEYAAAYRLLETVLFLSWAVARALFPAMSAAAEGWRVRRGIEQGTAALAAAYVPFGVGLALLAEPVLRMLYGGALAGPAADAARWLAPAPLLFGIGYLASYGLLAAERRWRAVALSAAALAANVALNLLLVPGFGVRGAAMATSASYLLQAGLGVALCAPVVGRARLGQALGPPAAAAAAMAAAVVAVPAGLVAKIGVGAAVYAAAWWTLARRMAPHQLAVIGSIWPWSTLGPSVRVLGARLGRALAPVGLAAGSFVVGVALARVGAAWSPAAAVALPVAAVAGVALLARPRLALAAFFLCLPVGFVALPLGGAGLEVVQGVVVLGAGATILRRMGSGLSPLPWAGELRWGILLVAAAIVATPDALDRSLALKQDALLVLGVLACLVALAACRSMDDVRRGVGVFLLVGAGMCAYGAATAADLRASFAGAVAQNRAEGIFGQPNDLGAFAAIVLALGAGAALGARTARGRAGGAAAAMAGLLALTLSLSRGAWLGALVGLAVLGATTPRARRAFLVAGVPVAVLAVALGWAWSDRPEVRAVSGRLSTFGRPSANPYDARPLVWAEAVREVRADPWTGQGPGNFAVASSRAGSVSRGIGALHAHDVPLTVAAEIGLPGLAALAGLTLSVGAAALRAIRRLPDRRDRALAAGLAAAAATQLGHGTVDFVLRSPVLFLLLWTLVGLLLVSRREAEAVAPR